MDLIIKFVVGFLAGYGASSLLGDILKMVLRGLSNE